MNNLDSKKFECTGCFLCKDICPVNAINMERDKEGFYHYSIDQSKCIDCGLCVSKCPKIAKKPIKKSFLHDCYAAYSKNYDILISSSSGGIFSEFAKFILDENGVVFGAIWENGEVKHICVDKINDLEKLRGAKYIQSNLDGVYKLVKKALESGRKVLFSGTTCQIAAINNFIKSNNLYTIDVVCHGVSSKKVLDFSVKQRYNQKEFKLDFRNKVSGWYYNYSLKYSGKNFEKTNKNMVDGWFIDYIDNKFLKKDCYNCKFIGKNRISDITLGDFWGIKEIDKKFYDRNKGKGVSLLIINSKKGEEIFYKILNNIIYKKEDIEQAIKYNPRINNGKYEQKYYDGREQFFKSFNLNKYTFRDKKELILKIKKVLKKIKLSIIK